MRRRFIAFAINLFFLVLCLFLGKKLCWGVVDDYFMARILEGVYGNSYNVHLTFVNVLYGYVLLPLYYLFPQIGWYYIGEIFAVFISFSIISCIIIKKMGLQWGTVVSVLFIACFARDYYFTVQFTQCAAALGAAGMLFFIYNLENGFCQKKNLFLACALIVWGFCMRRDALLMGAPFLMIAFLFLKKSVVVYKFRFFIGIFVLFCGLWGAKLIDDNHYTSPEYKKYIEMQAPRVLFGDKKNYDKNAVLDEIEENGLYVEDFSLLTQWTFYDTEIFAYDSLKCYTKKIIKYTNPLCWRTMLYRVLKWFDVSVEYPGFWLFFIMGFIVLSLAKKNGFYVFSLLLVLLVMVSYLLYLQRLVYRVESGLLLYASVLLVPLLKEIPPLSYRKFSILLGSLFFIYSSYFYFSRSLARSARSGHFWNIDLRYKSSPIKYKMVFDYMESQPSNTIFLVSMSSYMAFTYYRNSPYYSEQMGSWKRIIPLGYWTPYFPDVEKSLEEYKIENPMRDIVKENVVVIGNDEMLLDFLHRHYYENATVDTLRDIDGVKFFKYSVGLQNE